MEREMIKQFIKEQHGDGSLSYSEGTQQSKTLVDKFVSTPKVTATLKHEDMVVRAFVQPHQTNTDSRSDSFAVYNAVSKPSFSGKASFSDVDEKLIASLDKRQSYLPATGEIDRHSSHRRPCLTRTICDDDEMECLDDLVKEIICKACRLIESDPRGFFIYKEPSKDILFDDGIGDADTESKDTDESTYKRTWPKIKNFNYDTAVANIREYIGQWELSPATKCVVMSNQKLDEVPNKGKRYYVDAHFSKPTPKCPNPLAVAKVRFVVTVSDLMPKYYPIMVTYHFETLKMLFYALGHRERKNRSFQRFYIDAILHAKLSFYAAICECRHGPVDEPADRDKAKEAARHKRKAKETKEVFINI